MSDLIGNPEYRFSHDAAHLSLDIFACANDKGADQPARQASAQSIQSLWIASSDLNQIHGMQRTMISVDNFFVFLRLLFFALLLLFVT